MKMSSGQVEDFENDNVNNDAVNYNPNEDQDEKKMLALMRSMAQAVDKGDMTAVSQIQQESKAFTAVDNSNYWDITGLPTGGLLYPAGTKIMGRPLKVLEVKKLTSINEYNAESVITEILRKCVKGIPVDEIYLNDKIYILFWLRANSYRNNSYVVDFECPKCEKESTYHFDVNSIQIKKVENFEKNIILESKDHISLKFLQIKDEKDIGNFRERYEQMIVKSGNEVDEELVGMAYMIDTINGKALSPLDKYNYVLNLDPQDFSCLLTHVENNTASVKPYMNVSCNLCGGETQLGLSFRPDFFLPRHIS